MAIGGGSRGRRFIPWQQLRNRVLAPSSSPRFCLACGALAGPLFVVLLLGQDLLVPGFDIERHLLSQLALGRFGWIQTSNFILCAVLNLFFGLGLLNGGKGEGRKALSFSLLLLGSFLLLAGIFRTDPSRGFPPGSVALARPSPSAVVHAVAALFAFLSLIGALLAFARFLLLRRERALALYALACIAVVAGSFLYGMMHPDVTGLALQVAVLIGWTAPSVLAAGLAREARTCRPRASRTWPRRGIRSADSYR